MTNAAKKNGESIPSAPNNHPPVTGPTILPKLPADCRNPRVSPYSSLGTLSLAKAWIEGLAILLPNIKRDCVTIKYHGLGTKGINMNPRPKKSEE